MINIMNVNVILELN